MQTTELFSKELLFKITELGFSGCNLIGKGVVFLLKEIEADEPLFYIKEKYATQVKSVNHEHKTLITEYLLQYNQSEEIIVFHYNEVLVLNAFEQTGKTSDDYRDKPKPVKAPKKINYQRE